MNIMTLAMDSIEFHFQGTASHAAAYPEKGVNALDAEFNRIHSQSHNIHVVFSA